MNIYITLFAAVALEVLGTMLLPVTKSFTKMLPSIVVVLSYGISIYFLAILSQKLSLAIIYASWAGLGVFSVTFLSYIFFQSLISCPFHKIVHISEQG